MSEFKDFFSDQSADYARFRPQYPKALFRHLAKISPGTELAWDCGAGNGQASVALAEFFTKVIATEPSEPQLASAQAHPKVEYRRAPAEATDLSPASADLITVAQAFHWFDQPKFFAEVRRVAKPGAVLAVWCYARCSISPAVDAVVMELYEDILGSYWDNGRRLVEEGYRNEKFPFAELEAPRVEMSLAWTFPDLIGYLGTWSALVKYRKAQGQDPRGLVMGSLQSAWGDLRRERLVTWPLSIRVFRVNP